MKGFRWLVALAAMCTLLAACGGSSSSTSSGTGTSSKVVSSGTASGKLVVDNESGSTWTCQFNPFNPAVNLISLGFVYEPLEFVNILQTNPTAAKVTPWLATRPRGDPASRRSHDDPERREVE